MEPMTRSAIASFSNWVFALWVASLFLFVRGYEFNAGDQAEHLPQVYQSLDPELFHNDYFVPVTQSQFTVRHYYEQLALLLAKTIGLEWGAFILTLVCLSVMAWAFQRMAWHMFRSHWAAWLAPIMVLLVFYNFTVGGNHITYNTLISSTLAKALASIALLQALHRRWLMTGILLGAASLFQVLVGLQLTLVLTAVIVLIPEDRKVGSLLALWCTYLALALFILAPTLQQQFGPRPPFDAELYHEVLYHFRNYHHYLPSLFPLTHYIKFVGVLALGVASYLFTKPSDRGTYPMIIGVIVLGMLTYTIGLEVLGLQFLGKVQWFKTSIWASGLSAVMIAGVVGMIFQSIIPATSISRILPWFSVICSTVLLVAMTNSALLPSYFQGRYTIGNRSLSELEKMHAWIGQNTAKDAMVLVSPDNNSFSCQAKRPMPVHFHAIIHEPGFMLPWYANIRSIYGVGVEDINETNARTLATQRYQTRNYRGSQFRISYRLDNKDSCLFIDELGPKVHEEGPWSLTEFIPE